MGEYLYSVLISVDHQDSRIRRRFHSRASAMNFALRKISSNTEVAEEIYRFDKHHVEYVCTDGNRFWVSRELL